MAGFDGVFFTRMKISKLPLVFFPSVGEGVGGTQKEARGRTNAYRDFSDVLRTMKLRRMMKESGRKRARESFFVYFSAPIRNVR